MAELIGVLFIPFSILLTWNWMILFVERDYVLMVLRVTREMKKKNYKVVRMKAKHEEESNLGLLIDNSIFVFRSKMKWKDDFNGRIDVQKVIIRNKNDEPTKYQDKLGFRITTKVLDRFFLPCFYNVLYRRMERKVNSVLRPIEEMMEL